MKWLRQQKFQKPALILFLSLLIWSLIPRKHVQPSEQNPIVFYANQCDDEIRICFIKAIQKAKKSIFLHIYSLNDREIIKTLNAKKLEGIDIRIIMDKGNTKDLHALKFSVIPKDKKTGLMHQKILVVDESYIYIGSANFTSSSLRAHDNLIIALYSPEMAANLLQEKGGTFWIHGQKLELYLLPEDRKSAFIRLAELLDATQKNLDIAMFTWTHPQLIEKVLNASKRNVSVRAVLDQTSASGVSKKSVDAMVSEKVFLKINSGSPLLHHKFAYIDQSILIMGSTNWTKAAFSKNDECILIIHNLTKAQCKKMDQLCHAIRSTAKLASLDTAN